VGELLGIHPAARVHDSGLECEEGMIFGKRSFFEKKKL